MKRYVKNEYWIDEGGDGFYIVLLVNEQSIENVENTQPIFINESAYEILKICEAAGEAGLSLQDIIGLLTEEYELNEENQEDIGQCVLQLLEAGLIREK